MALRIIGHCGRCNSLQKRSYRILAETLFFSIKRRQISKLQER